MALKKINAVKTKVKKCSPELIKAGIVIVTAVTTLTVKHLLDSRHMTPRVHEDDLEWVREKNTTLTYSIDGHDYSFGYIGTTPDF